MKKLLLIGAAFAVLLAPAMAAEKPVRVHKRVRPVVVAAPAYTWTGWYAGINFGGGWGTSNNPTTTTTPLADDLAQFFPGSSPSGTLAGANSGVARLKQSGQIGGFQFGYNWQFSPLIVVGFEADIQGSAIGGHSDSNTGTSTESFAGTSIFSKSVTTATSAEALQAAFSNAAISASGFNSVTADVNWLGTVRARLGYLVTPSLLLYATGGLAYGGVSASATDTLNFGNLTADSFALGYAQALGGPAPKIQTLDVNLIGPSANAIATTSGGSGAISAVKVTWPNALGAFTNPGPGGLGSVTGPAVYGPPTVAVLSTASGSQSSIAFAQASKPLSAAVATTTQTFARVSDTKFGGTIGGGFEWMMAPNLSVKAEALYYDLGSVTVSAPLTSSINPLTAAIPPVFLPANTLTGAANVTGAINKFVGPATVSNTAMTHVNFQGVIIRIGFNYHFNWGG